MALWRGVIREYLDWLPFKEGDPIVTLGEGGTPLVAADAISRRVGADVFLKVEGANPTGSFKDRGMTTAITHAVMEGSKAVICASTGNTSASAAAYAARAGLTCIVVLPQGKIAAGKMAQAIVHGARLLQVDGNFDDCLDIVRTLVRGLPDRTRQLPQPVPAPGSEDGRVRDLRRPGGRARHPRAPRRQRREHLGVLDGVQRVRGEGASDAPPAYVGRPGRGRRALRQG